MEHYQLASSEPAPNPPRELGDINVQSGSKIKNIVAQSLRLLQERKLETIHMRGSGPTITKTITCAEIVKRKVQEPLYQINKIYFTKVEDKWEPKLDGLDEIQVTRKVPAISIILSTKTLDPNQPGYQAPVVLPRKQIKTFKPVGHDTRKKRNQKRVKKRTESKGKHSKELQDTEYPQNEPELRQTESQLTRDYNSTQNGNADQQNKKQRTETD